MLHGKDSERDEIVAPDNVKIFYSSRTHSQLTQFAEEVRRINLSTPGDKQSKSLDDDQSTFASNVKYLTLGSRRNLCINHKVAKLGSTIAINEKCLELQSANTPIEGKCPFVPNQENKVLVEQFGEHVMADVRDIEELGNLGKKMGICPYYASRNVIKSSEVSVRLLIAAIGSTSITNEAKRLSAYHILYCCKGQRVRPSTSLSRITL